MIKSAAQSSLLNDTRYTSMSAGTVPSDEYLIASTVLTQNEPSITFDLTGLSGIYKNLQLVWIARTANTDTLDWGRIRFNGSTSGYANHSLVAFGANTTASSTTDTTDYLTIRSTAFTSANGTAGSYAAGVIDILDPFNSSKNTTIRYFGGIVNNPDTRVALNSGLWNNTTPLTSIQIWSNVFANFLPGSRFSLYGVTV